MQINPSGSPQQRQPVDVSAAKKVIAEFNRIAADLERYDNVDRVDLNRRENVVEFKESRLGQTDGKLYTGKVEYDPDTKEKKDMFVTVNDKNYGGVGINYSFRQDDKTASYWRDDLYQEAPLSRYIQEVVVDKKTNAVISYTARDERDDYLVFPGGEDQG